VKIFAGNDLMRVESNVNDFLKGIPGNNISDIKMAAREDTHSGIAVMIIYTPDDDQ
jgi:hypothetical protein